MPPAAQGPPAPNNPGDASGGQGLCPVDPDTLGSPQPGRRPYSRRGPAGQEPARREGLEVGFELLLAGAGLTKHSIGPGDGGTPC